MMSKYRLYLGDCLEFMRTLDAGSVDAVVTDPPYDERTHKGAVVGREKIPQGGIGNVILGVDFAHLETQSQLAREFIRISATWSIVFCTFEDMGKWRDEADKFNAWVRAGVWDRVNPAPWMRRGNVIGEVSFDVAKRWGTVGRGMKNAWVCRVVE